jgi:hypothetical protein
MSAVSLMYKKVIVNLRNDIILEEVVGVVELRLYGH